MPGALVISLDFELLWGVRDLYPGDGGAYRANLLGARTAIPNLLQLFAEFEIAATWATVGMLFANSRAEIDRFSPAIRPAYLESSLDAYTDVFADGESNESTRYAPSLLRVIADTPRQEIGSHTFAHYYPLEPGSDEVAFGADLDAAVAIGQRHGVRPRSLVIPRNQLNPDYLPDIARAGFTSVRANASGWPHRACPNMEFRKPAARMLRLADAYAPITGKQVFGWNEIEVIEGVACIPASHFVRPYSARLRRFEPLRFHRLSSSIREAARSGGLCHLWWHPHNFGVDQDQNLAFLRKLLEVYRQCRQAHGMESMSMGDVAEAILRSVFAASPNGLEEHAPKPLILSRP
jgi:peptidoglycan/xylan/chitin deacetylase (PgdA/CDA1 family)